MSNQILINDFRKLHQNFYKAKELFLKFRNPDLEILKVFDSEFVVFEKQSTECVKYLETTMDDLSNEHCDLQYYNQMLTTLHMFLETTLIMQFHEEKFQDYKLEQKNIEKHLMHMREVIKEKGEKQRVEEAEKIKILEKVKEPEEKSRNNLKDSDEIWEYCYKKDPSNYVIRTLDQGEILVSGVILKGKLLTLIKPRPLLFNYFSVFQIITQKLRENRNTTEKPRRTNFYCPSESEWPLKYSIFLFR